MSEFSCLNCGISYIANPPDSLHEFCIAREVTGDDVVTIKYTCKNCKQQNILSWIGNTEFDEEERRRKYKSRNKKVEVEK